MRSTPFSVLVLSFASMATLVACTDSTDGSPTPSADAGARDAAVLDAAAAEDAGVLDASDGGCPASWSAAPAAPPAIALPDGGGGVLLHVAAAGTQNYQCLQATGDAGVTYAWTFVGPEADLADCSARKIGRHFASDAGAAAPAWETTDDATYVIGKRVAGFTPDGGAASIPWLLLEATSHGGGGPMGLARHVHRLSTSGGVLPSAACDAANAGASQKVPYTADYFFYGP
jgi:hypothetical protein